MNIDDLPLFAVSGYTLNLEERASLSVSLPILQSSQHAECVLFWGKVWGAQKDYLIAQISKDDKLSERKYFYSFDAQTWVQLPDVTPQETAYAKRISHTRFLGDPAFEYTVALPGQGQGESSQEEGAEESKTILEEKRIAAIIQLIHQDAAVAPRGALYRDATDRLRVNKLFSGLPTASQTHLDAYFHLREDVDAGCRNIQEREQLDESIDIFENLEDDQPKGLWSIQTARGGDLVLLRHLGWPGFTGYHQPSSAKWGYMYNGTGQRNVDVGFML